MINMLETVARELNPLSDFDRFRFYNIGEIVLENDQSRRSERIRSNSRFLLWTPKVMVRGVVAGAVLGGLAGILSDNLSSYQDFYDSLFFGGYFGFWFDTLQYWTRGAYHLFKGK